MSTVPEPTPRLPAGRDGLPSECILYYARRDVPRIIQMLRGKQFRRGMELLDEVGP